jgi:hypothetical protein
MDMQYSIKRFANTELNTSNQIYFKGLYLLVPRKFVKSMSNLSQVLQEDWQSRDYIKSTSRHLAELSEFVTKFGRLLALILQKDTLGINWLKWMRSWRKWRKCLSF